MAEEGGRSRSTCSGIPGIRSHAVAELPGLIEKLPLDNWLPDQDVRINNNAIGMTHGEIRFQRT